MAKKRRTAKQIAAQLKAARASAAKRRKKSRAVRKRKTAIRIAHWHKTDGGF